MLAIVEVVAVASVVVVARVAAVVVGCPVVVRLEVEVVEVGWVGSVLELVVTAWLRLVVMLSVLVVLVNLLLVASAVCCLS